MYDSEEIYGNLKAILIINSVLIFTFGIIALFRAIKLGKMDALNKQMIARARPLDEKQMESIMIEPGNMKEFDQKMHVFLFNKNFIKANTTL